MNTIRIILVDDHSIVREGLRMILDNAPEIEVVGEADNMTAALALVRREQPDVILLDLDLGSESALDSIPEIISAAENSRILVLTGLLDRDIHRQTMKMGASGVVLKNQAGKILLKAIEKVYRGESWIERTLMTSLLAQTHKDSKNNEEQAKIATLTGRERDFVKLIAEGLVNKEIAARLFLSEKTVRNSLTIIYSKLNVANRLELAIYAARNGLDK